MAMVHCRVPRQRLSLRGLTAVVLVSLSAALASSADLPDRWRAWRYSRSISAPVNAGPTEVRVPWEVYPHCAANCADLRLIDSQGQETPYQLLIERPAPRSETHNAPIIENSFVAGKFTQVIGDLGHDVPAYDRVRVETDQPDFIVWAEVALSDNGRTWRVVEPRAPIARFRQRSVDGTQTIPFQGLSSRYVRVRIFQATGQFPVHGLSVLRETEVPASLLEVPTTFQPGTIEDPGISAWTTTLAEPHAPISQLRLATDSDEFYRAVRISVSADGKEWSYRASGVIYRYQQDGKLRESLSLNFSDWEHQQMLRVDVINGNDQPLRNVRLSLLAVPARLLFKSQSGARYRLLYGNEKATPAQYDLSHYFDAGPAKPLLPTLVLGAEEVTTNYVDPRPFTERHPEVLWVTLGIAIVVIGLTAVKTLRSSGNNSAPKTS